MLRINKQKGFVALVSTILVVCPTHYVHCSFFHLNVAYGLVIHGSSFLIMYDTSFI